MPAKHARSGTRGIPPFGRHGGIGNKGSTRSRSASGSSTDIAAHISALNQGTTFHTFGNAEVLLRALNLQGTVGHHARSTYDR